MLTSAQQLTLASDMEKWYVAVADYACKTSKGIKTKNNITCLEGQLQIIASIYNNMSWQDTISFQYPIYSYSGGITYDMSAITFPTSFKITIGVTDYVLGNYIANVSDLTDALNALGMGTFFYSGNTITVIGSYQYGDITDRYTLYTTFTNAVFPKNVTIRIGTINHDLGTQSVDFSTAANALNLGHWIYTLLPFGVTSSTTVYGFEDYQKIQVNLAQYDLTTAAFPAVVNTIVIDGVTTTIGSNIASIGAFVIAANALNKGIFSYDSGTKLLSVAGGYTYGNVNIDKTFGLKLSVGVFTPAPHNNTTSPVLSGVFTSQQPQNGALTQSNITCLLAKLAEGVAEGTGKNVTPNYLMWGTDMVNDILDFGSSSNQHIKWRF